MKDLIKKILKEEEDFDWIKDQQPVPKEKIVDKFGKFREHGYYPRVDKLVEAVYKIGLTESGIDELIVGLDFALARANDGGYEEGAQNGWGDGHTEGYHEAEAEYEDRVDDYEDRIERLMDESDRVFNDRYEEGYDEGEEDGYKKGFSEGGEAMYHKAFEEGRAYESGKDTEYYERGESDFNFGDDEELD